MGLESAKKSGFMEVCHCCLDSAFDKGPRELLDAARQAAVHNFGWPIGVVLENNPKGKPRPAADGIFAEIHSRDNAYDYWALNRGGDFYSLISLFEDERSEGTVFFDTRIIRTTEAILHSLGLYKALGAEIGARIQLTVSHGGLSGRVLRAASPERDLSIFPRVSTEDLLISPTIQFRLGVEEPEILDLVKFICSPLFEVFDFQVFENRVYSEIVTQFIHGA